MTIATSPFGLLDLKNQYDYALQSLSDPNIGMEDDKSIAMSYKQLEHLLLICHLLTKTNDIVGFLTPDQGSTINQTLSRCEILLDIMVHEYKEAVNQSMSYGVADMTLIEVHQVGRGQFTWTLNASTEIDLTGVQLEEEEKSLIAMANMPIPNEGTRQQSDRKASISQRLRSVWGSQYEDILSTSLGHRQQSSSS